MSIWFATSLVVLVVLFLSDEAKGHGGGSSEQDRTSGADGPRSKLRDFQGQMTMERLQSVSCLLGVFTSGRDARHATRRAIIRSTWGSFLEDTRLQLKFIMTGRHLGAEAMELLQEEAEETEDLVILQDKYYNETSGPGSKMFEFLAWALEHTNVTFVAKVDEDVYLHPYHLQRLLVTLPRAWQYWGLLQRSDNAVYMASWFVLMSHDMLEKIHARKMIVDIVLSSHNSTSAALRNGVALGQVVKHTALSINQMEAFPADNFELYDWGPDKNPAMASEEADDGQPPYETIGVHALRRTVDFNIIHDYFVGSLLRWRACFASGFEDPPRCHRVLNFELNMR